MPPCTFLLSKGLEHFFQCFTLLRGKLGQKFQKLLLFLRGEPVFWLRMILAVHKRYLLLSANPVQLSVGTNLTLIFIIGIPGKTCELHALGIVKCAAKDLAMGADDLLGFSGFFRFKANAFLTANLLVVQPGRQKALTGALVQIGNFFSDCSKASLICSFAKAIRYSLMPFKMKSTFVPVMAMLPDRAFL